MKKLAKISIILAILLLYHPQVQASVNAGFVPGIWYSQNSFFAGENIRIYSAIQNQSGFDITGKINFVIDDKVIDSKTFSAINGRLVENWTDWKASEGSHTIYAIVTDAQKIDVGKTPENIELAFGKSQLDSRVIDLDTDKDKIGNQLDPDDDNDGLTDEQEKVLGSNPLLVDSDHDGLDDKTESQRGTNPIVADNTSFKAEKFALSNVSSSLIDYGESANDKPQTYETLKQLFQTIPIGFNNISDKIADKLSDIEDQILIKTQATGTTNNWQKSYLALISFLVFLFSHKILLLLVIIALILIIIKIFRSFRGPRNYRA